MTPKTLHKIFFSPTLTTQKVVSVLGNYIAQNYNIESKEFDFTLPQNRIEPKIYGRDDIVVFGVPVYAGRVPSIVIKYIKSFKAQNSLAIAVVVYGNRAYEDSLLELKNTLQDGGFKVVAAGAFVGEHSFSRTMAANRPNTEDLNLAESFAQKCITKITSINNIEDFSDIEVSGDFPYRPYYKPNGNDEDRDKFLATKPKTSDKCTDCKICVNHCPTGAINPNNVKEITGVCVKCCACVKLCPVGAKYFDTEIFLMHKKQLEDNFMAPAKIDLFV